MSEKMRDRSLLARKKAELTGVDKILQALMTKLDMPEDTHAKAQVLMVWEEVSGNAAPHSNAFRFQGSTLVVEVDSSIWINELSMRKSELMDRLERAVGERVVEDIRFQVKKKRRD
jgi:predicted nucleic acid-binding Zn ribbon protein